MFKLFNLMSERLSLFLPFLSGECRVSYGAVSSDCVEQEVGHVLDTGYRIQDTLLSHS